jgi:hypothetical protein
MSKEIELIEEGEPQPKTQTQIGDLLAEIETRVWYHRCCQYIIQGVADGTEECHPETYEGMHKWMAKAENNYPGLEIEVFDNLERGLGRLEKQMYALRWVLGLEELGFDT